MDPFYVHLGENVKSARKKARITQAALAEVIGVSPSHFSGMECGKKRFNVHQLEMISRYLGIPFLNLFTGLVDEKFEADFNIQYEPSPTQDAARQFQHIIRNCSQEQIDAVLETVSIIVSQMRTLS